MLILMPIIEYKNIERLHTEDRLLDDAGYLLKAGMKIGDKAAELAKHMPAVVKVISLTKEEQERHIIDSSVDEQIQAFIEKRHGGRLATIRERLKETAMSFYSLFDERGQIFSLPGKKRHIEEGALLANKSDPLYEQEIAAGASRIITKYKWQFATDMLKEVYDGLGNIKPRYPGEKQTKGAMPKVQFSTLRLSSKYDGGRFSMLGDAYANQAVDTALMFLYVMTNINKQRIAEEAPLSEARFNPDKKTSVNTRYQYRSGMITDAAAGILLHNIGYSHSAIHQLVTPKPVLLPDDEQSKAIIRKIQRNVNVARNLVEPLEISSISKMMIALQRDYPDGTGFPYLNENKYLHEFVRLFHIIKTYDSLTNPVCCQTVYSRNEVLGYLNEHSGPYIHNPDKFTPSPRFDEYLVKEFRAMLAPYETGEKVYLYHRSNQSQHLFVGKVHSYGGSEIPVISLLKDEKQNREYRDGTLLLSIADSTMFVQKSGGFERKHLPWIKDLVIIDKGIDPGDINTYTDPVYGKQRSVSKHYQ
ncbi:MAG: hypothetical protein JXB03_08990 [Spirochaetales bacterium]|nr:hypothetical protein [Spirochaetales bacterium]